MHARQRMIETGTAVVVEGYTDVVMAHQYGATNVVSVLGTALTEQHVNVLRRFARKIVLLFDADEAGDLAVNRAVELFLTQDVEIAIASIVGKFKLSQNRREDDKLGVLNGLSADPESESQAMAALVKEHGFGGSV